MQSNLEEVGIKVELQPVEHNQFIKALIGAKFKGLWVAEPLLRAVDPVDAGGERLPVQRRPQRLALRVEGLRRARRRRVEGPGRHQPGGDRGRTRKLNKDLLDNLFLIELAVIFTQIAHSPTAARRRPGPSARRSTSARPTSRRADAMTRYLLRRVPSALLVLVLASMLIFAVIRLVPGDPVATLAGPDATPGGAGDDPATTSGSTSRWSASTSTGCASSSPATSAGRYLIGGDIGDLVGTGAVNTLVLTAAALLHRDRARAGAEPGHGDRRQAVARQPAGGGQHARRGAADLRDRAAARARVRGAAAGAAGGRRAARRVHRPAGHRGAVPAAAGALPGPADGGGADPLPHRGAAVRSCGSPTCSPPRRSASRVGGSC